MRLATTNPVLVEFKFPRVEREVSANVAAYGFYAFITQFRDDYQSNWDYDDVYGRMDPIASFKNTQRTISCGLDVPAESSREAVINFLKIRGLQHLLYPIYKQVSGEYIMSAPPLAGVHIPTLIEEGNNPIDNYVYGTLQGVSLEPDFTQGVIDLRDGTLSQEELDFLMEENTRGSDALLIERTAAQMGIMSLRVIPKLYRLSFNLRVIHKNPLGWAKRPGTGDYRPPIENRSMLKYFQDK